MGKESLMRGGPWRLTALVLAGAVICAAPCRAQEPRLLLGDSPKGYDAARAKKLALLVPSGDPKKVPAILWLRPNTETTFYPYVENRGQDPRTVKVQLWSSSGTLVAESPVTRVLGTMPDKESAPQLVALSPPAPAAPPPPPKEPPAAKEPAVAWVTGAGLPAQFELRLLAVKENQESETLERIAVAIPVPRWYVEAAASYSGKEHRLTVRVRPKPDAFAGGGCHVQLVVFLPDPEHPGKVVPLTAPKEGGTLERTLSLDMERPAVELTMTDPRLALLAQKEFKQQAYVTLTVDGYERAFRFESDFSATGGETPLTAVARPSLALHAPLACATGADWPVRLACADVLGAAPVNDLNYEVTLQLDLGRDRGQDGFDSYETRRLPGHRFERILVNAAAPGGALVLKTEVQDWDVPFPTKGLFGKCDLRVRVLKKEGTTDRTLPVEQSRGPTDPAVYRQVIIDGTPPEITKLGVRKESPESEALPQLERGEGRLPVFAITSDPESDIKQVLFFLSKPAPDPKVPGAYKMPEGAMPVEGQLLKNGQWVAQLPVKAEKAATVDVSVQVTNNAGLVTFGTVQVELVEKAAKGATGNIEGKVFEGDRPQPEVEVTLRDAMNMIKGTAVTDKKTGAYVFKDLPPGAYRVSAVKSKSGTRGEAPAQVEAGKTTKDVNISLLR
jgi:hypothetical protein